LILFRIPKSAFRNCPSKAYSLLDFSAHEMLLSSPVLHHEKEGAWHREINEEDAYLRRIGKK
jgi:hypothetical protein